MRVVIITDMHFGARNSSKFFIDRMIQFFDEVFFPTLLAVDIKELFILGDTFDNRKTLDIYVLNIFKKHFFDVLQERGIKTTILIGNHDSYFKDTIKFNSISYLGELYDNIDVVHSYKEKVVGGRKCGFTSWICPDNEELIHDFIRSTSSELLFGHFEIKGFEMTRGQLCSDGMVENELSRFHSVYSGHFHVRGKRNNITYISNQIQLNWSDFMEEKGFGILDMDTLDMKYINNPSEIFRVLSYESDVNLINFPFEDYRNTITRIIVTQEQLKEKKFSLLSSKLADVAYKHEIVPITSKVELNLDGVNPDDTGLDNLALIVKYMSQLNLSDEELGSYIDIISNLYHKALEVID